MDNSAIDLTSVPSSVAKFLARYSTLLNEKKFGKDGFASEFGVIKQHSVDLKKEPVAATVEGLKEENRKKNRYKDILPFDATRIVLDEVEDVPCSDYINATCIQDPSGKFCYIAAQGPMPSTVTDFWRMICQYKVEVIVMACREIEMGRHRCQRYWPEEEEKLQFNGHTVSLLYEHAHKDDLKERQILVSDGKLQHKVTQYHFTSWPDHDAPAGCRPILNLLNLVRGKQPGDDPPMVIHCSAGCGRTGAIIAVDYARKIIEDKGEELNIFNIVMKLRKQRPAMVQTKEQYHFLFQAVHEMICRAYPKKKPKTQQKTIDAPMYVNVDVNVSAEPRKQSPLPVYENLDEYSSYSPKLGRKLAVKPMNETPVMKAVEVPVHSSKPLESQQTTPTILTDPSISFDRDAPEVPPKSPGSARKQLIDPGGDTQAKVPAIQQSSHVSPSAKSLTPPPDSPQPTGAVPRRADTPKKPSRQAAKSMVVDTVVTDAPPPRKESVDSLYAAVKKCHSVSVEEGSHTYIEVWSSAKPNIPPQFKPMPASRPDQPDLPPMLPERTPDSFKIVFDNNVPYGAESKPKPQPSEPKPIPKPYETFQTDAVPVPVAEKVSPEQPANKQWLSAGVSKLKKFGKWTPHKRNSSTSETAGMPLGYEAGSSESQSTLFYMNEHLGFKGRIQAKPAGPRDPPKHWPSYAKWPVTRI